MVKLLKSKTSSSLFFKNLRERISDALDVAKSSAATGRQSHLAVEPLEARQLLTVVSDFSLTDVNPNSATYGQDVSPRDFLGEASAWYFGHST